MQSFKTNNSFKHKQATHQSNRSSTFIDFADIDETEMQSNRNENDFTQGNSQTISFEKASANIMQDTITKLQNILEQKMQMENIQKEKISKMKNQFDEDQINLSKLQQVYSQRQYSFSELKTKNHQFQQEFDSIKIQYAVDDNNDKRISYEVEQLDAQTQILKDEIQLFDIQIEQLKTDIELQNTRIEAVNASKNAINNDLEKMKQHLPEMAEWRKQFTEMNLKIQDFESEANQITQQILTENSKYKKYQQTLQQLNQEQVLLKKKNLKRNESFELLQEQYSKLKYEIEEKEEVQKELETLQDKLHENEKLICETAIKIKDGKKQLARGEKNHQKRNAKLHSLNATIQSLKPKLITMKNQIISIQTENIGKKNKYNEQIKAILEDKLQRAEEKFKRRYNTQKEMELQIKNMTETISKLQSECEKIGLLAIQIKNEQEIASQNQIHNHLDEYAQSALSPQNLSIMQQTLYKVEKNYSTITSMINGNHSIHDQITKHKYNNVSKAYDLRRSVDFY